MGQQSSEGEFANDAVAAVGDVGVVVRVNGDAKGCVERHRRGGGTVLRTAVAAGGAVGETRHLEQGSGADHVPVIPGRAGGDKEEIAGLTEHKAVRVGDDGRRTAAGTDGGAKGAVGQHADAVVRRVGDVERIGLIERNGASLVERDGVGDARALGRHRRRGLAGDKADVGGRSARGMTDDLVDAVGHVADHEVHVAGVVYREASRRGRDGGKGGVAAGADNGEKIGRAGGVDRRQFTHAVVAGVGDEQVACNVCRDAGRGEQALRGGRRRICGRVAGVVGTGSDKANDDSFGAAGVDLADAVVALVGDKEVAAQVERDGARTVELQAAGLTEVAVVASRTCTGDLVLIRDQGDGLRRSQARSQKGGAEDGQTEHPMTRPMTQKTKTTTHELSTSPKLPHSTLPAGVAETRAPFVSCRVFCASGGIPRRNHKEPRRNRHGCRPQARTTEQLLRAKPTRRKVVQRRRKHATTQAGCCLEAGNSVGVRLQRDGSTFKLNAVVGFPKAVCRMEPVRRQERMEDVRDGAPISFLLRYFRKWRGRACNIAQAGPLRERGLPVRIARQNNPCTGSATKAHRRSAGDPWTMQKRVHGGRAAQPVKTARGRNGE